MSSHHFVRDKQEPALIIANGESCSLSLLNELLEWNPFIIVLDGAIHRVAELGFKFDVLLGDFDRDEINFKEIEERFSHLKVIHSERQDNTDLEKALDYLVENGYHAANIVWATGKRADHTMTNITSLCKYRSKITCCIYDDYSTITLLPRLPLSFKKWYPKATIISLIPIGTVSGITTNNLKYNLTNESLVLGYRTGSSNEVLDEGLIEVAYTDGDMLLMECFDNKR